MQARGSAALLGRFLSFFNMPGLQCMLASARLSWSLAAPPRDRFIANSVSGKILNILHCYLPTHVHVHRHHAHLHCFLAQAFQCFSPVHRHFAWLRTSSCFVCMHPSKPPGVPTEIWELELPSILGAAHPAFRGMDNCRARNVSQLVRLPLHIQQVFRSTHCCIRGQRSCLPLSSEV